MLEKALSLAKSKVEKAKLFYNWASVCEQERLLEDAKERFKEVLKLISSPASFEENNLVGETYFHLGTIYKLQGKYKEAERKFEECLKYIMDHQKAVNALKELKNRG